MKQNLLFPKATSFSAMFFKSHGARNCPFFTLRARPVAAAERRRSVCRQRKAGICNRSIFAPAISASRGEWTSGYQFPGGYRPRSSGVHGPLAVLFTFSGFRFTTQESELYPAGAALTILLVPLTERKGENGGLVADDESVGRASFPQFEQNADHIIEHIEEYRQERLIRRAFAYGELASLLRVIKDAGFELAPLADAMDAGAEGPKEVSP